MLELSIVIPTYNEADVVKRTTEKYFSYFDSQTLEVIVSDGGSTDKTQQIVKKLQKRYPELQLIVCQHPGGKGAGVYKGFSVSRGQIIGFTDADCSTPPKSFARLVRAVRQRRADLAIASRYLNDSQLKTPQPKFRMIFSRAFNLFVRLFFDLPYLDTQCGAKVMRRGVYEKLKGKLKLRGFAFDVELLWHARQAGFTVVEVGVEWSDKENSSIGGVVSYLKTGITMVKDLLKIRYN